MSFINALFWVVVGLWIGLQGPTRIAMLIDGYRNRKLLKKLMPTPVDESKLCKGPHSWIPVPIYGEKGPATTQVCQICGFMPELKMMATQDGLDAMEDNALIKTVEDRIYKDFLDKEDNEIKAYFNEELAKGISFEKLTHIHGAGMTFGVRFREYRLSRNDEILKVLNRSDA